MDGLPIVMRRDLLGEPCLFCDDGTYRARRTLNGDWVRCDSCGLTVDRWLTKRDVLEVRHLQCAKESCES